MSGEPAAVPNHCGVIDKSFEFVDPCNEETARMKKGNVEWLIRDWFGKGAGPNRHRLDKAGTILQGLADIA